MLRQSYIGIRKRISAVLFGISAVHAIPSYAGTLVQWQGNDNVDDTWTLNTNWFPNRPSGSGGDSVLIGAQLGDHTRVNEAISIASFAYDFGAVGAVLLGDGISNHILTLANGTSSANVSLGPAYPTDTTSTFTFAANLPVQLAGATTFTIPASGQTFIVAGAVTGTGAFTKAGPGTLRISASNPSYSGSLTISSGTLMSDTGGGFGTNTLSFSGNSSTLGLTAGTTVTNSINIPVNTPAWIDSSTTSATLSGAITGGTTTGAQLKRWGQAL